MKAREQAYAAIDAALAQAYEAGFSAAERQHAATTTPTTVPLMMRDLYERLMFYRTMYLNPHDGRGQESSGYTYLSDITRDLGKWIDAAPAEGGG